MERIVGMRLMMIAQSIAVGTSHSRSIAGIQVIGIRAGMRKLFCGLLIKVVRRAPGCVCWRARYSAVATGVCKIRVFVRACSGGSRHSQMSIWIVNDASRSSRKAREGGM